jgi:single-stranded-DNA-specific exonuclease
MPLYDEWVLPEREHGDAYAAVHEITEARIAASGLTRDAFLRPTNEHLHDGALISGMGGACDRIEKAIRDRERILIYGDYDVDGVTSIVLLSRVVSALGGDVGHVVPHRLTDGYGLKIEVLERVLADQNVRLVITVDCGITSVEPVARAIDRGIDVIITDHHLPPGLLPDAAAVLNPKVEGCEYPYKDLAGVGVAFKLCCELLRRSGRKMSIDSLMKIAALGTIADVAPLTGENRAIVRIGLHGLADVRNIGLRALLLDLGLFGKPLRASDVGFRIGPRINAAGRLASADTAIDLFRATSDDEARRIVAELNRLNGERQTIERAILVEADALVEASGSLPPVLLLVGEGWHKGVLGLCAGRVAQKYHRPTLVLSRNGDECVGSGRSVSTFDLHGFLSRFEEIFTHFGGHEFACGFSLAGSRVESLKEAIRAATKEFDPSQFQRRLAVDAVVDFRRIDAALLREHDALEPFGAANRQPIFVSRGARVAETREFSPGCFNVALEQGGELLSGTLWRSQGELQSMVRQEKSFDVAYTIAPDPYGRRGIGLQFLDFGTGPSGIDRNENGAAAV